MNYRQARDYIEKGTGKILPGLSRIEALMGELGHPEKDLSCIHIAGTNGKGSILAYISTTLTLAGYKVGRYVSPTLYSYRERFQIDGCPIDRECFRELAEKVAKAVDRLEAKEISRPSAFELETALSLLYFQQEACDWVVLECGMGGREDATNVIPPPELVVFASINMDHMKFLGNTLEEIAYAKAGIIKRGCQVVTCRQPREVQRILEEECARQQASLTVADVADAIFRENKLEGQHFLYKGVPLSIRLAGSCQGENAITAYEALKILQRKGLSLTDRVIQEGLAQTVWKGRFTCIGQHPYFFVDGAHNPAAAQKLRESIETYFPNQRKIFINGVFADKDYREIIRITAPLADQIFAIAAPGSTRALPAQELAGAIAQVNPHVQACASLEEAVDQAYAAAKEQDVILAFGSLAFIGELTRDVTIYREKMCENDQIRPE